MSWRNQYRLWRYPELGKLNNDEDREQAWKTCRERMRKKAKWWIAIFYICFSTFIGILWRFTMWPMAFLLSTFGASRSATIAILGLGYILFYTLIIAVFIFLDIHKNRRHLRELLAERGIPICTQCGYDLRSLFERRCPECGKGIDDPAKDRPRRMKMILALGIPLAALLSVNWGFIVVGQHRLNRALEEARKLGPVTYDEIAQARRAWKDQENGAMVIVNLGPQLDCIKKETEESELPLLGNGNLPNLGQHWPIEVDQLVRDELQRRSEELGQINRLIEFKGGRFPLTIAPKPTDTLLPHLAQVRTAVRLKSLDTIHRITHGDTAYFCDDIEIMFTLGRLLEDEPVLISALVRNAVDALTVSIIEQVCAQDIFEPDVLLALEAILATADLDSRLYWGILGERALFVELFRWMQSDTAYANELEQIPRTALGWGVSKGLLHDQAVGLAFWNRYVTAIRNPTAGPQVGSKIGIEVAALPDVYLMTKMVVPDFGRSFVLDMKTTSQIRAARTALAVERYRIAHGRWPEMLDQLVPEYLAKVPLDPFDGRPLRYCLDDDAVVIYAIDENRVDDGGDVASLYLHQSENPTDCGFVLLAPSRRGLPAEEGDAGR